MSRRPSLREALSLLRVTRRVGTEPGPDRTAQSVSTSEFSSFFLCSSRLLPPPCSHLLPSYFLQGHKGIMGPLGPPGPKGEKVGVSSWVATAFRIWGRGSESWGYCGWASVGSWLTPVHTWPAQSPMSPWLWPSGRSLTYTEHRDLGCHLCAWHQNKNGHSCCLPGASS